MSLKLLQRMFSLIEGKLIKPLKNCILPAVLLRQFEEIWGTHKDNIILYQNSVCMDRTQTYYV